MASTPDLAPSRPRKTGATGTAEGSTTAASAGDEPIEAQVARLQDDIKAIAASLARLSGDKVSEVRDTARHEYRQLVRSGQQVVEGINDQASVMERQLKDVIREKPFTAVASALGIGYLLAILSRR